MVYDTKRLDKRGNNDCNRCSCIYSGTRLVTLDIGYWQMTETIKVWKSGVTSPRISGRSEWIFVNEEYPHGRYTLDEQLAQQWAEECASMCNSDPNSGGTDWVPAIWQEDLVDQSNN
jgi:hypothetical protein